MEREGSLVLCERLKVTNEIHFLELLNKHIDAREEGVVIKRADAKYQPGKRERSGWFKIKPDVISNQPFIFTIEMKSYLRIFVLFFCRIVRE